MGHWHIGCNTPGYLPESEIECVGDIAQATWIFRDRLQRAIDSLPAESEVPGMDDQYLAHSDWLCLQSEEQLVKELEAARWLGREVHDGRCLPTLYWVREDGRDLGECESQAGGELR